MKGNPSWRDWITPYLRKIFSYYLSLQFMKYGFDKIFKGQFYLPEPNILFTSFGNLDKDIAFWSTMGLSHSYSFFMGLCEVIPALLLLHKKTRTLGLILSLGVLLNIVAINFSYDISVKVYSLFLLALAITALSPQLYALYSFFIQGKNTELQVEENQFIKNDSLRFGIKFFVIGMIFLEALFPYIISFNFNDDQANRPYLHGAYKIENINPPNDIKRFFIHRRGYLIFQNTKDEMSDYSLKINRQEQIFTLTNYHSENFDFNFSFSATDSILTLQKDSLILKGKMIDWKKMPALQQQFHWSIEEVK